MQIDKRKKLQLHLQNNIEKVLKDNNIEFEEINIEEIGMSREQLFEITGGMSVPHVIINDKSIKYQ